MNTETMEATTMNKHDQTYHNMLLHILNKGKIKPNRTGTPTIGVFGYQARFDMADGFPLLTTKKVNFHAIMHELFWFLRGDSNIKYLMDNGVNIWNKDAYRNYVNKAGEHRVFQSYEDYVEVLKNDNLPLALSDLGTGTYGSMWRSFPYFNEDYEGEVYIDQIQNLVHGLKTNPTSRRHIVSAWHPYWVDHCALPPCHVMFQCHTEELTSNEKTTNAPRYKLHLQMYQRSCDTFLGVPFNIASYSLLLCMLAHCTDMVPGEFIHDYGDLHIYVNHLEQVKEQLGRSSYPAPKLKLNPEQKNLVNFSAEDIELVDYKSHGIIKGELSV